MSTPDVKLIYPVEYVKNKEKKTAWRTAGVGFTKPDGKVNLNINVLPINFDGNLIMVPYEDTRDPVENKGTGNNDTDESKE